jgi:signal transduction histidine kinase
MTGRLVFWYLAVFGAVLFALNALAYVFVGRIYAGELEPALSTPEAQLAYGAAMRHVAGLLAAYDVPLLLTVGVASYLLARLSFAPLAAARDREAAFAADAAHELRTPLAQIAALAQLGAEAAPARGSEEFSRIAELARDAAALVSDLLTLSRAQGAGALILEPVDLGGVLLSGARGFESRARERGVELALEPSSAIIEGDERRLLQLVRNLLDNALRHARTTVRAAVRTNGTAAFLEVEDDGPGVAAEHRERIFERFVKVPEAGAGTGLGLAIGRWVARAHRGDLSLEGRNRFSARFPLAFRGKSRAGVAAP